MAFAHKYKHIYIYIYIYNKEKGVVGVVVMDKQTYSKKIRVNLEELSQLNKLNNHPTIKMEVKAQKKY